MKRLVVVVCGPTGVGKSDLAFQLARRLNGELISCDSVQVYRGLNIGANKTPVDASEREHLIDIASWREEFTAGKFYDECKAMIKKVQERERIPILVGGTGFYIDWILKGKPGAPPCTDEKLVEEIEREIAEDGGIWSLSLKRLERVDQEYAKVILANDYYRLKRALVVHRSTGKPLSLFKRRREGEGEGEESSKNDENDYRCLYLTSDREYLYRNIDKRCEKMIQAGLIKEVFGLMEEGLEENCSAGRSIGYFETLGLIKLVKSEKIKDSKDLERAFFDYLEKFQAATRQYSRRQDGWFKKRIEGGEFIKIERPWPFDEIKESSPIVAKVLDIISGNGSSTECTPHQATDAINPNESSIGSRKKVKRLLYKSAKSMFEEDRKVLDEALDFLKAIKTNNTGKSLNFVE